MVKLTKYLGNLCLKHPSESDPTKTQRYIKGHRCIKCAREWQRNHGKDKVWRAAYMKEWRARKMEKEIRDEANNSSFRCSIETKCSDSH